MGLVRFELTIDGSLRITAFDSILCEHISVLQRFLTDRPRRVDLSRPVVHHLSAGAHRHAGLGHSPIFILGSTSSIHLIKDIFSGNVGGNGFWFMPGYNVENKDPCESARSVLSVLSVFYVENEHGFNG